MSASPRKPCLPSDCRTVVRLVSFFDLARLAEWANSTDDEQVASFLQSFYELAAEMLEPAGGRIVKFIGDAGLVVFPEENAERGILALCAFSAKARDCSSAYGFDTCLNINVHIGPVVEGTFGPAGLARYDVIGKTVNVAARLGRRGVTLSAQAFRCLNDERRKMFDKVKQPITYRLNTE